LIIVSAMSRAQQGGIKASEGGDVLEFEKRGESLVVSRSVRELEENVEWKSDGAITAGSKRRRLARNYCTSHLQRSDVFFTHVSRNSGTAARANSRKLA
jgi:hypothetical protein